MSNKKSQENLQNLAETLEVTDGVEVVAQVDIDNKSVQDVLIVKDSRSTDETDKGADKADKKAADDKNVKSSDDKSAKPKNADKQDEQADEKSDKKDAKDTAESSLDVEDVETVKQNVEQNVKEAKQKVESVIDDVKDKAKDKIDDVKDAAAKIRDDIAEKIEANDDKIGDKDADDKKDTKQDKTANSTEQDADKSADKTDLNTLKDNLKDGLDEAKAKIEDGKTKIQEGAEDAIDNIKERLSDAKDEVSQKIEAIKETAEANDTAAKGGVAGILGKLGSYLNAAGGSKTRNTAFHAVDLDANEYEQDAFRKQTSSMSARLLGAKFTAAQSLVGKVVPSVSGDGISEFIFDKAANWANNWAKKDLLKDSRFINLSTLTDAERDDFACDVANQNRALAVMGGLAGFAGIKGVVADMAWLLMVSLKSVYQLALIYDKPLTGKEGVKIAYGVLSGANLNKLQEKQVILTALALGNAVFANAERAGLKQELKNVGLTYRIGDSFDKQLDELSKYVNIDNLNLGWLGKILPVTSVAVGAYYNHELIEEVLGTAMATFRPERPQLLTDKTKKDDASTDTK